MAKIIEHGKYWVPEAKKAYKNVKVKCPECDNTILISYYYLEMDPEPCAWCECGCKFIPEGSDIVEDI